MPASFGRATINKSDKANLENQRAANRAAAVEDVRILAAFVADARNRGLIEGRGRLAGVPIVAGGRLWQMVVLAEDHRAVFNRCLSGEYASVSSAGRDAGLARSMPRRRVEFGKDMVKVARAIFAALNEAEWLEFATELARLEGEREQRRNPRRRRPPMFKGKNKKWKPDAATNPRPPLSGSRII